MKGDETLPQPTPLPAALGLQPDQALPLSSRLSLARDGDQIVYFLYTDPIASHAVDDKLSRNLCLGRYALLGLATQAALAQAFDLNPRTVARAKARLKQHGEGGFALPRKQRRRHGIEDPQLLVRAARMLNSGLSLYRVAKELGVSTSTLWRYSKEGLLPASQCPPRRASETAESDAATQEPPAEPAGKQPGPAPETAPAPGKEERNRRDAEAPLGRAARDTEGRVAASLGLLDGREPRFEAASAVSGGGVLTALPSLLRAGLLRHADLLTLPKGFYGLPSLLLLWAFLLLGRVRSPERLRYEQPGEWGALLGLDRCPCPRTLRRRTRYVADSEGLRAWVGALARHWCEDDPDTVATLFVDGHVQVYSGKGQLPKHFVSRQKLALPAAAGYWVHALGGAPLLCLHRQVDAGMVAEIWNGIVPQLQQMGLVAQGGETQQQEPCLTLVFDREGWSPRLFRELRAKGIAVVTWIKGAQAERWPDSEFREASIPVRAPCGPALLEGQLAERKPGPGQRQPALLTTHPSLAAAQAAGLLRSRWTQENYFKYQRAEFGLDTLPEHALVEVDEHAWVVNPAWREIDNALKKERNRVGHLRRKRALEADAQSATALALGAQIQASDGTIEGLVRARQTAAHHVQAGELSEAERLQVLPRALRLLMDTLRMIAYRAETAMATAVAPELDNPETARSLLKSLFRGDASLHPDEPAGTLTVRLLHQPTHAQDRALAPLLDELNRSRTVFPGTQLRLVYKTLSADESCLTGSQAAQWTPSDDARHPS